MAFEYLLAYYLLDCKVGNVMLHMNKAKYFQYRKMPRHIEGAILLMKMRSPDQIDLKKYRIHPSTLSRFRQFNEILHQNSQNPQKAQALLSQRFHDTYWYYVRYSSPYKTKVEMKARAIDESVF